MNLTFRCKHIKLADGITVKEPIIPVFLQGNKEKLPFTAVLDSGSDFVLLPIEVAEALELDFDKSNPEKAKVYSGDTITTCYSWVFVTIKKGREQVKVKCRCAIQLEEKRQHENIIFGSTFFEHFRIHFDYPKNKFEIKSAKS